VLSILQLAYLEPSKPFTFSTGPLCTLPKEKLEGIVQLLNQGFHDGDGIANLTDMRIAAGTIGYSAEQFDTAIAHLEEQNRIMRDDEDLYQI
jgi:hypothetical protein